MEMIHPLKTNYLKPSEEAVYTYLMATNHYRTQREIALAVGLSKELTAKIVVRLVKFQLVLKRKREYGFDCGILEFRGAGAGARGRSDEGITNRRKKAEFHRAIGFEPLHVKMKRLVGVKRAREIERL